jgi:hypothetical protein
MSSSKEDKPCRPQLSNVVVVPLLGTSAFNHTTPTPGQQQQARQWMVVSGWQSLGTMVATATAKATATVTATAKGWGQAVDSAIIAKLRLGGLRPAITDDKKL